MVDCSRLAINTHIQNDSSGSRLSAANFVGLFNAMSKVHDVRGDDIHG